MYAELKNKKMVVIFHNDIEVAKIVIRKDGSIVTSHSPSIITLTDDEYDDMRKLESQCIKFFEQVDSMNTNPEELFKTMVGLPEVSKNKTRYEFSGNQSFDDGWYENEETAQIDVFTPHGVITAMVSYDSEYPGIYLLYTDKKGEERTVCILEHDTTAKDIALKVWENELENEDYQHRFHVIGFDEVDQESSPLLTDNII